MIVVNVLFGSEWPENNENYELLLVAVINDTFSLKTDYEKLTKCLADYIEQEELECGYSPGEVVEIFLEKGLPGDFLFNPNGSLNYGFNVEKERNIIASLGLSFNGLISE